MKTVITPEQKWALALKDIRSSQELLYFFSWRNFKIRYKQTIIGALWAVLRPFILMVVFTLVFNKAAGIKPSNDIPYPVFAYTGLLFWTYFSQTVTQVSSSLVSYQSIIKKIYFPRLLVPASTAITGLIDFAFSTLIFICIVIYFGTPLHISGLLLFLPLVILTFITVLGVGLFMAALNVRYRDVEQLMPFAVQVLLFLTPVIYPINIVADKWQWILYLNPMTGIISLARSSLLGTGDINPSHLLISISSSIAAMAIGLAYFRSQERDIEDLI